MRFFSKRLGLIIWGCLIAALLLIPAWRLRAARQWDFAMGNFKLALAPDESDVPYIVANSALPQPETPETPPDELSAPWEREAARRFPDDPLAQIAPLHKPGVHAVMAPGNPRTNEIVTRYFARYDALQRRFPASNAIRAQRLRDVTRGDIPISIPLSPQPGAPGPSFPAPPLFAAQRAQWEAALQTARAGARLEPDNAFFPWMEAVCAFALRRDDDAIAALKRAGSCARFDDYLMSNVRARVLLMRRLRATGWEDDYDQVLGALLPHLARMSYAATALEDRARRARKAGDEARALELAGLLQRAGAAIARADDLYLTRRMGEGIVVRAWKFALENQAKVPVEPRDTNYWPSSQTAALLAEYQQQMAAKFEQYARAHNRADLALEAQTIAARFDAQLSTALYQSDAISLLPRFERLGKAWWLGSVALFLGAIASLIWLVAWPFSRRAHDAPARRKALGGAMFVAGVTLILLIGLLVLVPNVSDSNWNYANSGAAPTGALLWLSRHYLALILLLWLMPSGGALLGHSFKMGAGALVRLVGQRDGKWIWWRPCAVLVGLGFAVGSALSIWNQVEAPDSLFNKFFPLSGVIVLVGALAGSLWLVRARVRNRALMACLTGAFWLSAAVPLLSWLGGDGPFYGSIAGALAVVAALLALVLATRGRQFPVAPLQTFAFQLAARTRVAAGVLALLCAIAYLGIALWTIPIEAQTRAQINRQLQIGEVAWLREQIRH